MSGLTWAAMQLSEHPNVCAALVRGLPVARERLRPDVLQRIGQPTMGAEFVLTEELALRVEVSLNGTRPANTADVADWLIDAADLLAEPDPGPTPWLVENLIVDGALVAAVGPWKTTKSYGLLEIAVSIRTGLPAFGRLAIPEPGPVVFVIEESGRAALWRRLDALCRGRAIAREDVRGLHLATNAGVKLDDPDWQQRLVDVGQILRPRLFVFDPLARMKAAARDENAQGDMAALIEFLRTLRDETGAGVAFVHHTGHQGGHMRGSSDLESMWETRLSWKREPSGTVELSSEHREVEESPKIEYRIAWEATTRSIRLAATGEDVLARVKSYLADHPDASANAVFDELGGNRKEVLEAVKTVKREGGTNAPVPAGTAPLEHPFPSGTPGAPFRGPGTTSESAGTKEQVPPLDEGELERLDQVRQEMGL